MSEDRKAIKRALISVYDKTGLEDLAKQYSADSAEAFEEQYGKDEVVNSLLYDKVLDYVAEQAVVK